MELDCCQVGLRFRAFGLGFRCVAESRKFMYGGFEGLLSMNWNSGMLSGIIRPLHTQLNRNINATSDLHEVYIAVCILCTYVYIYMYIHVTYATNNA